MAVPVYFNSLSTNRVFPFEQLKEKDTKQFLGMLCGTTLVAVDSLKKTVECRNGRIRKVYMVTGDQLSVFYVRRIRMLLGSKASLRVTSYILGLYNESSKELQGIEVTVNPEDNSVSERWISEVRR